jgi:hypothetical protein
MPFVERAAESKYAQRKRRFCATRQTLNSRRRSTASPSPSRSRIVRPTLRPRLLGLAAGAFVLEPALFRPCRRPGRLARLGRLNGLADQFHQAVASIIAVARLATKAIRLDHQPSVRGYAPAGKTSEPPAHVVREHCGALQREPKLHRSSHLVDVLTTRSLGAYEDLLEFALVQHDCRGYEDFPRHTWVRLPISVIRPWLCYAPYERTTTVPLDSLEKPAESGLSRLCPLANRYDWD